MQRLLTSTHLQSLPTEFFHLLLLGNTFGCSEGFCKEDTANLDEAQ
jgi:hypothetical protein